MKPSSPHFRTLDLAYIALFAVLIAVSAWISIPFSLPFTLQTFAVFLALMTLGGSRGFYAILVYLLMGLVGFPVFSGFQGGLGILLGPNGGYLTGFLFAALLYWLITSRRSPSRFRILFASLAGLLVCYGFGTAWYAAGYASPDVGLWPILSVCVLPFILPDLIKLFLAFAVSARLSRSIR